MKIASGWAAKTYLQSLWIGHKITDRDYRAIWAKQVGKCPGCMERLAHPLEAHWPEGLKPMIEGEGKDVRGLFCGECRKLLHLLDTDTAVIKRLLEYVK